MDHFSQSLAVLRNDSTPSDVCEKAAQSVFRHLAESYAHVRDMEGRHIMVVTSAVELDSVGLSLAEAFRSMGADVYTSCVTYSWHDRRDGRHEADWRSTYREGCPADTDVVVAMSVVTEPNEVLTITRAALEERSLGSTTPVKHASLNFIFGAASPCVTEAILSDPALGPLVLSGTVIAGVIDPVMRFTGEVSPSLKRAGVVDPLLAAQFYPRSLLEEEAMSGSWEGHRPSKPGFISAEEDMLHDFEELDRINNGVLSDV